METVLNMYRICVRKWCASCERKEVDDDGTRICTGMQLKVPRDFICPKWQLSYALQQAGRSDGVVKLKSTHEIIIK